MREIALVTGVTSGIGRAMAVSLAKANYNLIITGRRNDRLEELKSELINLGVDVLSLCFDVRDNSQVESNLLSLPKEWSNIKILINNAGLAVGLDPIQDGVLEDWERMLDTNVKGLLYVSKIVSKSMISNKINGHIINVCSIAGKQVYPNGAVYCASKHAVDAISQGLRLDLVKFGIKVSQICPGAVETEFSEVRFKGDSDRAKNVYLGFEPLRAEDVADAMMYILSCPPHVNINDMVIMPTAQASATVFNKSNI